MDLPLEDGSMVLGQSTLGLLAMADVAIHRAKMDIPEDLAAHLRRIPTAAESEPLLHADLLIAMLERLLLGID